MKAGPRVEMGQALGPLSLLRRHLDTFAEDEDRAAAGGGGGSGGGGSAAYRVRTAQAAEVAKSDMSDLEKTYLRSTLLLLGPLLLDEFAEDPSALKDETQRSLAKKLSQWAGDADADETDKASKDKVREACAERYLRISRTLEGSSRYEVERLVMVLGLLKVRKNTYEDTLTFKRLVIGNMGNPLPTHCIAAFLAWPRHGLVSKKREERGLTVVFRRAVQDLPDHKNTRVFGVVVEAWC
jgi:hypothetical protein